MKFKWWWVAVAILVVLILLPTVLAGTALRDRLLAAIISSDDVRVSSQSASFGYFSPLSLDGLKVESVDRKTTVEVDRIEADKSWLGLFLARPELGTFRFNSPSFDVTVTKLPADAPQQESKPAAAQEVQLPSIAAEINNASIVIREAGQSEPPLDLQDINVTLRIEKENNRSALKIDPATVFDHQQITPALCGRGLQLVAPLLADEIAAAGEFSLRLQEVYVPLGSADTKSNDIRIEGELELHQASAALKNTIATQVANVVVQLMGSAIPDVMTVARDVTVRFKVIDGRVHHEGLALLLPSGDSSIQIVSNGSVGLDESLDLQVAVQIPDGTLGQSALAKQLTSKPITIAVGGNLNQPQIRLPEAGGLVGLIQQIVNADQEPSDGDQEPSDGDQQPSDGDRVQESVTGLIGDLLEQVGERRAGEQQAVTDLIGDLLNRVGERRVGDRQAGEPQAGEQQAEEPQAGNRDEPIIKRPIRPRLLDRIRRPQNQQPTDL